MAESEPLPRADRAVVPREKLEDYLLNPEHQLGRHKARVFAAALGIHPNDWQYLSEQLQAGVVGEPVASVRQTEWGALYEVVVAVDGLNGQRRHVMSVWLAPSDHEPPRLVTAYVLDPPPSA